MKTRKILSLMVMLLLAVVTMAQQAQMQMPPIPVDKDVKIGKLPNGLTYYIRHNAWPENRAEFYIAQKVGSIQEEESQRGLAHFLEHMCFNGTKHFPGDGILRWCESKGVKFGTDLNAYTSIAETVYNISNVPSNDKNIVDSCLLILSDWADGLTLDNEEIDKERGVIHEEWRMRTSASSRMFERNLPALYPGSKYGQRYPIGLMSVIDNFKYQELRNYYEKWYRPDNQGIIVVGDVDVNYIEQKIKDLFGGIKMPENPAPVVAESVPDNAEPIVIIDKDKEQVYNFIELFIKHDPLPNEIKSQMTYLVIKYMLQAATQMINTRIGELQQKPDCPYVSGDVGYGDYIFAKTKDAVEISAMPKEGKTLEEALAAVYREVVRAAQYGITPTEYKRFLQDYISSLDKMYSNKDKRYNSQFVNQYVRHFLDGEPIPSLDDYYQIMKNVAPNVPLEQINQLIKELIPANDSNIVALSFNNEKEGKVYPTKEGVLKAIADVKAEKLEAWVDNVKDEPLIATLPKKGSIKKEVKNEKLGYTQLQLSNGAKVILKKTDLKKDQVLLTGEGFGGSSLYGEKDFNNLKMFDEVISYSGLGNFSSTELQKALAGKIANVNLSLSRTRVGVSGSSTPTDVETMMQMLYLYFTNIKKDNDSFASLVNRKESELRNKEVSPEGAFSDSVSVTLYSHNPRETALKASDLQSIDYDRILQIAKEQTANAAAFTFTIIGNFDEATIRPLIEQYIASLPSKKKVQKGKNVFTWFKGNNINNFKRKMETPAANSILAWASYDMPYSQENIIRASITGEVLQMIYLKKIREDAGAAYSCGAQGTMMRNDFFPMTRVLAYCPVKPDMAGTAIKLMNDEIKALGNTCESDKLTKVKEYMLKNISDARKTNNYWASVINAWTNYGVDIDTDYEKTVEAQTPETISAFVRELLKGGNYAEILMLPE
ncbi:MAG: insulinase family protein [Prevotella sp.]|nr:insulinase family protein [Prevotella sp.]